MAYLFYELKYSARLVGPRHVNTRKFVTNRDPASPHHMLSPRMGAAIMTPNQRM